MQKTVDRAGIDGLIRTFPPRRDNLIRLLQALQTDFGYLPEQAMLAVADYLKMSSSSVYAVATFYTQFKFKPAGRHCIKVCMGTACHVKGSAKVLAEVEKKLGIKNGETTPDLEYSLETEACFGSCALAPLVIVDDKFHGRVSPENVGNLIGDSQ